VDIERWVFAPGVPANAPTAQSSRLSAIAELGANPPSKQLAAGWMPLEWQIYLESLPRPAPQSLCEMLDATFQLSESHNYEILVAWLVLAISSNYSPALPAVEKMLGEVGRMKYLRPIYTALSGNAATRQLAFEYFSRFRSLYHPIARHVVDSVLQSAKDPPV